MAFELRSQAVDLFPLKSRFVKPGVRGDLLGNVR